MVQHRGGDQLLVLAPIEPCRTGNGLAMRVASVALAAARQREVSVAVVPVAGRLGWSHEPVEVPVRAVDLPDPPDARRAWAGLVAAPEWRALLANGPLPGRVGPAPPSLARQVLEPAGVRPGTPVHCIRSYLAPLGLAVAGALGSPWATLDLDDDDEAAAAGSPDREGWARLVSTFAPRFSAVSLASPADAAALADRHRLSTRVVVNEIPARAEPVAGFAGPGRLLSKDSLSKPTDATDPAGGSEKTVLFVGNLTYGPNVDAALRLVTGVLPALTRALGPGRIRVVNALLAGPHDQAGPVGELARRRPAVSPGPARADIGDGPGCPTLRITVTGFVEDLSPLYRRADVVVAPLRGGSGTRIKLLEAFAHGVPVVTTPDGAAGLAMTDRQHLLIGRTDPELASAAAEVLTDGPLARGLAAAAERHARATHGPEVVAAQVEELFEAAQLAGPPRVP